MSVFREMIIHYEGCVLTRMLEHPFAHLFTHYYSDDRSVEIRVGHRGVSDFLPHQIRFSYPSTIVDLLQMHTRDGHVSAQILGTWEIPKDYAHLFDNDQSIILRLKLNEPISETAEHFARDLIKYGDKSLWLLSVEEFLNKQGYDTKTLRSNRIAYQNLI